jgi:hypothetical protein
VNEKKEQYDEAFLVSTILGIIEKNPEAEILIFRLGPMLQAHLQDNNLEQFFLENYGGLVQFLRKHQDKFLITGLSPHLVVSKNEQNMQERLSSPSLDKQLLMITRYKTIPCQSVTAGLECSHGKTCVFSHGNHEKRRNPLSPFFVSYSSRLPSLQEKMEFLNLHELSEEKINELLLGQIDDFPYARTSMEVEYSPENYRSNYCPTTALSQRCTCFPVCSHAHNQRELRFANLDEKNTYLSDLLKNNLPYMFQQGKWQEALNFISLFEKNTKFAFLKKYELLFLITSLPKEFPQALLPWEIQILIAQSTAKSEIELYGHGGITTCNKIFYELHPFSQANMLCYPAKHGNVVVLAKMLQLVASVKGEADLIKLVNHGSCLGQTALHGAVACGRDDRRNKTKYKGGDWKNVVNLLVAFGAELSQKDIDRYDAFYFARKSLSQSQEKEQHLMTLQEGLTKDPINFRQELKVSVFQTIKEKYQVDLNRYLYDDLVIDDSVSSSTPPTNPSIASLIATQGMISGGRQGPSPQPPPDQSPPNQSQPPENLGDRDRCRLN